MLSNTVRIIASFVPQAWVNNYTVDVDPEGETDWDVTDYLLASYEHATLAALRDNREGSCPGTWCSSLDPWLVRAGQAATPGSLTWGASLRTARLSRLM